MKPKEKFLFNIQQKIKILQDAYNYNKNLPDDIFESLIELTPNHNSNGVTHVKNEVVESAYGENTKMIASILEERKVGMLKSEIIEQIKKNKPELTNLDKLATNALSSMGDRGHVKGYKPKGYKIKGYYWTMAKWWDGNKLKKEYEPKKEEVGN
jgi:hypothetical protein